MPPKKFRGRRNNKKNTAYNMAKKALKKVNKINRSIEHKFYDETNVNLSVDATPTQWLLNQPPIGADDTERIGDKIFCTSLELRMNLQVSDTEICGVRMIIYRDKSQTIQISDLLQATTQDEFRILSPYNKDKRHDWALIKDITFRLDASSMQNKFVKMRIPLNFNTRFVDQTTAIEQNGLNIFFLSNIPPAGSNKPNVRLYTRLNYTDL